MKMTEWIRLVATQEDKRLLQEISRRNGDAGFSATVRRLIRQEAARLGIDVNGCQTQRDNHEHA